MAENGQGASALSNGLSATPNPTQPSAPQGLTVSDRGDGFVELSWTEPADTGGTGVPIDHYVVYMDNANATNVASSPYSWGGLTNGVSHEFTVVAVNSAHTGLPSSVTSNAVGYPDAPIIGTRNAEYEKITITWSPGASNGGQAIVNYKVYIKVQTDPDPDPSIPTDTVSNTEYTFSCPVYTTYEYWVIADNGIYTSNESTRETLSPSYARPSAPQNLNVDDTTANQATVTWAAPDSTGGQAITNYKIEYSPAGGNSASPIIVSAATVSQVITELPATDYTFSVYASNDGGANFGPPVISGTVTISDPIPAPTPAPTPAP